MASSSFSSMACFFFLMLLSMGFGIGISSAAVLTVGDAVGWTIGKIDYNTWVSKKTFHVGDTLLFQYNNKFHNVMEVKKADYDSCNNTAPTAIYTTGKDSIAIKSAGDHFYLCGFPGHCLIGQKLKITALAKGSSAAPSMAPAGAPSTSPVPGGSSGSTATASPSEAPASGSSASPAAAPNAKNSAVAYKGVGMVASALAVAAGFMIMAY